MAITKFTDSAYSPLFKRVWGDYANNLYGNGSSDPLLGMIQKDYSRFKGSQMDFPINVTFGGSVGFGAIPTANTAKKVLVTLTRKSCYARLNLDRQTILASKGKEGAFKEATADETEAKLNNFMRHMALALYNDGTGILGQTSGSASGTAAAPVVTILATGTYKFRQAFFEEGDYVNVRQSGTTLLSSVWEITDVNISTRAVTLSRISGPDDLTSIGSGTHDIVISGGLNAVPQGIKGVVEFSSGSLYGVTFQRRWQSYRINASSNPISVDYFNKLAIQLNNRSGEYPNVYVASDLQFERFLNRLGDARRYSDVLSADSKITKVRVSFPAIDFTGPGGTAKIVNSRYVEDDKFYAVNTDKIVDYHLGEPGWFDQDGTVLLRMQDTDAYESRYGCYKETFINPLFQGDCYGLSTS